LEKKKAKGHRKIKGRVEVRFEASLGKQFSRPHFQNNHSRLQMCLLCKCKALSSHPRPTKKNKKREGGRNDQGQILSDEIHFKIQMKALSA
jgi:hypothetical protein